MISSNLRWIKATDAAWCCDSLIVEDRSSWLKADEEVFANTIRDVRLPWLAESSDDGGNLSVQWRTVECQWRFPPLPVALSPASPTQHSRLMMHLALGGAQRQHHRLVIAFKSACAHGKVVGYGLLLRFGASNTQKRLQGRRGLPLAL